MRIVLGVLGLIGLFVVWRVYATVAGGRRSYQALLARIAPITQAFGAGREPSQSDLMAFASDWRTRRVLHDVLDHQDKLHLFPRQYLTWEAVAEADMALWLSHPNELGALPDELELVTRVPRPGGGDNGQYFVFRFRTKPPHWAAEKGWTAGIAGPYDTSQEPRPHAPGTFSRFEAFDSRTPDQHVEMIDRMTSKGRR
jgi:hypothetical protein